MDMICSNNLPKTLQHVRQAHDRAVVYDERAWQAIWLDCRCHQKDSSGKETTDAPWIQLHRVALTHELILWAHHPRALAYLQRLEQQDQALRAAQVQRTIRRTGSNTTDKRPPDEWEGAPP